MFTKQFGSYVCEGDSITCTVGKFTATARIYHDDCIDKPDERDDGFWPSQDKNAAGYVLPENYETEMAKAKEVMRAWLADEWHYSGVVVTVECEGVQLVDEYDVALWGVERNYPGSDNSYLLEVANELLPEALERAESKLAELCAAR